MRNLGLLGLSGVGIFVVLGMVIGSNSLVFGLPIVNVSPTCGPADPGFNMVINANGFAPNSNVNWKLVNSESQIPLYGYFQTNSTGGFNDVTFADDLKADSYKMYFGTDANNDNKFDVDAPITYANLTIPCS
ncbi:MAG TPA: hypothetical protein VL854_01290 [Nitrososphaeraceae archaeon]|nr:hypothetical protein [Nitrososphaeraceae archaeon]